MTDRRSYVPRSLSMISSRQLLPQTFLPVALSLIYGVAVLTPLIAQAQQGPTGAALSKLPAQQQQNQFHPISVSAWFEEGGERAITSLRYQFRGQTLLLLPGAPGEAAAVPWASFWLECKFHPSKAGVTVQGDWQHDGAKFLPDVHPVTSLKRQIQADGTVRFPVSFDLGFRDAMVYLNCQGVKTVVHLRRWPANLPRPK